MKKYIKLYVCLYSRVLSSILCLGQPVVRALTPELTPNACAADLCVCDSEIRGKIETSRGWKVSPQGTNNASHFNANSPSCSKVQLLLLIPVWELNLFLFHFRIVWNWTWVCAWVRWGYLGWFSLLILPQPASSREMSAEPQLNCRLPHSTIVAVPCPFVFPFSQFLQQECEPDLMLPQRQWEPWDTAVAPVRVTKQ